MLKVRIHGRGGQGGKLAAKILGRAAFLQGLYAQDFPLYGAERRGAPVSDYVRISPEPILERGYIRDPNVVIVLDPTLPRLVRVFQGAERALKLVNSAHALRGAICVDATKIALTHIGAAIPNTAMLGAFCALNDVLDKRSIERAIEIEMREKHIKSELVRKNIAAFRACYEVMKRGR